MLIEGYYRADNSTKAVEYSTILMNQCVEQLNFILLHAKKQDQQWLYGDLQINMAILQELYKMADKYEKGDHLKKVSTEFERFISMLQ